VVVDAEKKENERKRKRKTLSGEKKEVSSKKSLTGPTLLEMYDNGGAFNRSMQHHLI